MNKFEFQKLQTNEERESHVYTAIDRLVTCGKYEEILHILINLQVDWKDLSIARLTKIIKNILDRCSINQENYQGILLLLKGLIQKYETKNILKHDLQCRLIYTYIVGGMYREGLELIKEITEVLKKFDDKVNMIRIFIYESQVYYYLKNVEMAKSALTTARAMAVSVACPQELQAQIDLLNGIFLIDDGCFDSAVGYFVESIEGFLMNDHFEEAKQPLRYLVLCKILSRKFDEIKGIFKSKYVIKLVENTDPDEIVEILKKIAEVSKNRDIISYKNILNEHKILENDIFISKHLFYYYNELFNQNILKIIEPYSHIKIEFIASRLQLDKGLIEDKLRMMILDKIINGILDHKTQCLILFEDVNEKETEFETNIRIMNEFMNKI